MSHPFASRAPVLIAAPFSDIDPARIEFNVRRAAALARLALAEGLHPVTTHATGLATGMSDIGEAREVLLGWGCGLVRLVAKHTRGQFWLLLHDDGHPSSGCRHELFEWERVGAGRIHRSGRWEGFEQSFRIAGLSAQWEALRTPTAPAALIEDGGVRA